MPGNLQSVDPAVIAQWPTPNYVDPVRRTWMPAYAGVLQAITTVMVGTRLVLRAQRKAGPLGLDDALLVPAFLTSTMFTVLIILGTEKYGMDRHIWDVFPTKFEYIALVGWLAEISFIVSTGCTKVSVLLFFRRLTEGSITKVWKWATLGAIAFTISYCLAIVLALIFDCRPTEAYWKSYSLNYTADYHCTDTTVLNPLSGALSILSDIYSVFLPMMMLWRLEATKRQKMALNAVFSLGLLVVAAGIVRTYYLERLGKAVDIPWIGFDVFVWSQLECQLAIICASAPALRVFFRRYLSDPITRAIQSSKNASGKSTNRESKQTDTLAIVSFGRRNSVQELGDCEEMGITRKVHISQESFIKEGHRVDERETPTSPSTSIGSGSEQLVKTPADFESFALENLKKQRTSAPYAEWRRS